MDLITLAMAKKFATKVSAGYSSVSISGQTITFTLNDGTKTSLTVPKPADGISVVDIDVNDEKHLICTMSDGNTIDAGEVPNIKGDRGDDATINGYRTSTIAQGNGIIVKSQNGLITIETDYEEASIEQIQDLFKTE